MTAIGADPDALDLLARALTGASGDLDRSVGRIDAALRRSGWSGSDAERFRRSWSTAHRGWLAERAAAFRSLSQKVQRQASEQRRASLSSYGATAATRIDRLPDATVVHGKLTGSFKLVAASLQGTLTVEGSGDRRLVTYSRERGVGVDASTGAGTEVHVGDLRSGQGATAGAAAFVEGVRRDTYSVDADDVSLLLAGLLAREGARTMPVRVPGASWLVDAAAGAVLPDPVRVEHLAGVEVVAGAWAANAGWLGPAGAASLSGRARIGVAEFDGERSLVLEVDGDAAAALVGNPTAARAVDAASSSGTDTGIADALGLGQHSVDADWSVRVEVPLGNGTDRPLLVTATSSAGDEQLVTRIAVDPTAAGIAAVHAGTALEVARSGDVGRAVRSLQSLRLPAGSYDVDFTTVTLDRRDAGGSVTTPVPGIGVEGSITELDAPD